MSEENQEIEDELVLEEDELSPKETDLEEIEELSAGKMKKMRTKLKSCEEEKIKCSDELQRAKADFLNSKKRMGEQLTRDTERVTEKFLLELLPLSDSFDMAMGDKEAWQQCDEQWRKGVEAIHAQLQTILKQYAITEIDALHASFNPELHDAVTNMPVENKKEVDTVVAVLQKGYNTESRILRPAKVAVGIME